MNRTLASGQSTPSMLFITTIRGFPTITTLLAMGAITVLSQTAAPAGPDGDGETVAVVLGKAIGAKEKDKLMA
jgi:hypothetical protein